MQNQKKPFSPKPCHVCGEPAKPYLEMRKGRTGTPLAVLHVRCINPDCPNEREAHIALHNLSTFNAVRKQMKNAVMIWNGMKYREAEVWTKSRSE